MEDEGRWGDHTSGVAATDGTWHHVAVTWDSGTGAVRLYDNGRLVWSVTRGKGKLIPSGGTLVIGREQVGGVGTRPALRLCATVQLRGVPTCCLGWGGVLGDRRGRRLTQIE